MTGQNSHWDLTWLGSDRFLARRFARPAAWFLRVEASAGIVLVAATVVAMAWANITPDRYHDFWSTVMGVEVGRFRLALTFEEWVNEGLMEIFFFVVAMEIKRELVSGELRDRKAAALPVVAAMGGVVFPALVFVAFTAGTPEVHGWGIPMATDIAFAVGIVSMLGSRVPTSLKLFLLTLAVVDDLGGILVIAVFYAKGIAWVWLAAAVATFVVMYLLQRNRVWFLPVYVVAGFVAWYCMLRSGVHSTIAGVVIGFITPTRPLRDEVDRTSIAGGRLKKPELSATDVRVASKLIKDVVPVSERLIDVLHPWSAFVVVPIFALANAGIDLRGGDFAAAISSRLTLGVFFGLVVGKTLGVSAGAFGAIRLGVATRPRGATNLQIVGIAIASGIGLTVAMFMTGVSFTDVELQEHAKLGILAASMVAAVGSAVVLIAASRRRATNTSIEAPIDTPIDTPVQPPNHPPIDNSV